MYQSEVQESVFGWMYVCVLRSKYSTLNVQSRKKTKENMDRGEGGMTKPNLRFWWTRSGMTVRVIYMSDARHPRPISLLISKIGVVQSDCIYTLATIITIIDLPRINRVFRVYRTLVSNPL